MHGPHVLGFCTEHPWELRDRQPGNLSASIGTPQVGNWINPRILLRTCAVCCWRAAVRRKTMRLNPCARWSTQ